MSVPLPALDDALLRDLRHLVAAVRDQNGRGVSRSALVACAAALGPDVAITVDCRADSTLGGPLVVVRLADATGVPPWLAALTPREREVLALVVQGLRNREIAARLCISLATAKDHVHHLLAKSGLANRAALIAACSRTAYAAPR